MDKFLTRLILFRFQGSASYPSSRGENHAGILHEPSDFGWSLSGRRSSLTGCYLLAIAPSLGHAVQDSDVRDASGENSVSSSLINKRSLLRMKVGNPAFADYVDKNVSSLTRINYK